MPQILSTEKQGHYAALSYCWGGDQPTKLHMHNLSAYLTAIDESTLPRTTLDAVKVTRSVGVRFLWIDAYCIIQDNENDKLREINRMDEVYKTHYSWWRQHDQVKPAKPSLDLNRLIQRPSSFHS
jgi:hypothetical protein